MPDFTTTRLAPCSCPYCGQELDAATPAYEAGAVPSPGDVTVCIACASPLVFTAKLGLRKPFPGELGQPEYTQPELEQLQRVMQVVRSIDRRQ